MNRRGFAKSLIAAAPVMPAAAVQQYEQRTKGLPPLVIKDVKVIKTNGGRGYRWVFLKIITSEPGLYGIGSANNNYQVGAVIAALEQHLAPWLLGKNPDRIEDLWQSANYRTYWRQGPINNNVLAAMDMALWDIKGKRAGMPIYELLGGKVRDAVACYDHAGGTDMPRALESVQKSMASGFRHIRVQYGEGGYGGGGFLRPKEGNRAEGGYTGWAFDEDLYLDTIPKVFDFLRGKIGFGVKLCHDVHSHLSGVNAVEFSRRMQPYQMLFLEDVLAPEQVEWYRNIRQVCSTPQAVGEVFSHPYEYIPLVANRLIDFVRCRISANGGFTPMRKVLAFCEYFGVKTAFQEGGENDPINQMASYHLDISTPAFGIQEENRFSDLVHEMLPGTGVIKNGYLYGSDKPGIGVDINEQIVAKYPLELPKNGGAYQTDRAIDGSVVRP